MFHNHINRHIFYIASLLITKFYICSRGRNNKTKMILSKMKFIESPFSTFIVNITDLTDEQNLFYLVSNYSIYICSIGRNNKITKVFLLGKLIKLSLSSLIVIFIDSIKFFLSGMNISGLKT